jgi:hypothetical protein
MNAILFMPLLIDWRAIRLAVACIRNLLRCKVIRYYLRGTLSIPPSVDTTEKEIVTCENADRIPR